jgi:hypothetical protein
MRMSGFLASTGNVVIALCASFTAQQREPAPAIPINPVTTVLDAFRSYAVVALSEGTDGNEQGHAFRLSLIRHPRFPEVVDDIVVEFGTARYLAPIAAVPAESRHAARFGSSFCGSRERIRDRVISASSGN